MTFEEEVDLFNRIMLAACLVVVALPIVVIVGIIYYFIGG